MTANRRIFLNIIATYGRSLYALVLGLFTARWALQALGQVDFGLYGVVGGLTAFIVYLNGILGGAIGRFYAVSVGEQQRDSEHGLETCQKWFTTAVVLNTTIPILLVVVGYPLGIWAVKHFLTIPTDRISACVWVWRFVCLSCFWGMVTLPLQAMYTAKQYIAELTIYSFVTTTLNAVFLYYMVSYPGDWLAKYAFWQCLLAILPQFIISIRAYCIFPECRIVRKYLRCWGSVRELCSYSLWNGLGWLGAIMRAQGDAILLNKYFGPKINAGFAVASSLSGQTNSLSGSLIGAFSPAIMNAWGAGDHERARKLAFQTCKIGTLFILIFALPLILEVDEVLRLWLKNPPDYAAAFCIFVLFMNIIDKLAVGHMLVVNANGKVALYQTILGTSLIMTLPIAWTLILLGVGPYAVGWAMVLTMIFCVFGRVWFARSLVRMSSVYWVKRVIIPIAVLTIAAGAIGLVPRCFMDASFLRVCLTTVHVELALLSLSWLLVLDDSEREFIRSKLDGFLRK